jgi:hypothetical protein
MKRTPRLFPLDGKPYVIRHRAKDGRFGFDDDVKHRVKLAIDLESELIKLSNLFFIKYLYATHRNRAHLAFAGSCKEQPAFSL